MYEGVVRHMRRKFILKDKQQRTDDMLVIFLRQATMSYKKIKYVGFTVVELLIVISIIALLTGIMLPVLTKVRKQARTILSMSNQQQIINAATLFSADNDERYPESVATIGSGANWHWQDPRMVTGYLKRTTGTHRAISEYLGSYLNNADAIVCPLAPFKYKYLAQAWEAGDNWDNSDTPPNPDPFLGSYCFYWSYVGYLGDGKSPFRGPRTPAASGRSESKLLISCYLGLNHWRSPGAIGSCEKLPASTIIPETFVASSYWAVDVTGEQTIPKIKLNAGYTDGHVETYLSSETVPMEVSITPDGYTPYPDTVGPGIFFLPANAVR